MSTAEETSPGIPPGEPDGGTTTCQQVQVVVRNPLGLHMRPASAFARLAMKFASTITVRKPGRSVNGKSLMSLLTLAAMPGTELTLEVEGPDACEAIQVLSEILGAESAEGTQ